MSGIVAPIAVPMSVIGVTTLARSALPHWLAPRLPHWLAPRRPWRSARWAGGTPEGPPPPALAGLVAVPRRPSVAFGSAAPRRPWRSARWAGGTPEGPPPPAVADLVAVCRRPSVAFGSPHGYQPR